MSHDVFELSPELYSFTRTLFYYPTHDISRYIHTNLAPTVHHLLKTSKMSKRGAYF